MGVTVYLKSILKVWKDFSIIKGTKSNNQIITRTIHVFNYILLTNTWQMSFYYAYNNTSIDGIA